MNVSRATIFLLAVVLVTGGCQPLIEPGPSAKPQAEAPILLDSGSATLAGELEKVRPLVDLNREAQNK